MHLSSIGKQALKIQWKVLFQINQAGENKVLDLSCYNISIFFFAPCVAGIDDVAAAIHCSFTLS